MTGRALNRHLDVAPPGFLSMSAAALFGAPFMPLPQLAADRRSTRCRRARASCTPASPLQFAGCWIR
ncbi:protein of unknown function (plasmid) [Caballeronia sp. S22]